VSQGWQWDDLAKSLLAIALLGRHQHVDVFRRPFAAGRVEVEVIACAGCLRNVRSERRCIVK